MRAQRRVTFDDVLDQIREQQIEVAKFADDDPRCLGDCSRCTAR
jgi:hypothetical protein